MNGSPPALRLRGLTQRYGEFVAVRDLAFELPVGRVGGLIGPNGSGKTTTIGTICGLLSAPPGVVSIFGCDIATQAVDAKRRFALCPESPIGFDDLYVREYLDLVGSLHQAGAPYRSRLDAAIGALMLERDVEKRAGVLSAGQRKKVSLVAAIALGRSLLVIDEPTGGLDPETVVVLESTIRGLAAGGRTIFVATQDLDFAERVCDDVFLMARGELVEQGSPAELCSRHGQQHLRGTFVEAVGMSSRLRGLSERLVRAFDD